MGVEVYLLANVSQERFAEIKKQIEGRRKRRVVDPRRRTLAIFWCLPNDV
jgi:hypothetical protein